MSKTPRPDLLEQALDIAMGALADIACSEDMTLSVAQNKAARVHNECSAMRQRAMREAKDIAKAEGK